MTTIVCMPLLEGEVRGMETPRGDGSILMDPDRSTNVE